MRHHWHHHWSGCGHVPEFQEELQVYPTKSEWLRTTINALWTFSLTLWCTRNLEYHGENGVISQERTRKVTALQAMAVYNDTICKNVSQESDSSILHRNSIKTILNWMKQHLDAYLATAEVICEWNIEPG
jgi:hypothetical protein